MILSDASQHFQPLLCDFYAACKGLSFSLSNRINQEYAANPSAEVPEAIHAWHQLISIQQPSGLQKSPALEHKVVQLLQKP